MASRTLVSAVATLLTLPGILLAQLRGGSGSGYEINGQAIQLDLQGKGAEARQLFQKLIDSADTPAAKANAQRALAMSWAFESNCQKTGEYEQKVIDYWVAREKEEPYDAFYQEGEMADEAGRVCIGSGDLDSAARRYQKGHDFGLKEPGILGDRKALWEFRWEHAQARIAARRGNRTEAEEHVAAVRAALDKMTDLRPQQEDFFPYLRGYVAFYLGDYNTALQQFEKVPFDAFNQCMLGQIYEKLSNKDKAMEHYRRASTTSGHNPPAAYARSFTRKKIG